MSPSKSRFTKSCTIFPTVFFSGHVGYRRRQVDLFAFQMSFIIQARDEGRHRGRAPCPFSKEFLLEVLCRGFAFFPEYLHHFKFRFRKLFIVAMAFSFLVNISLSRYLTTCVEVCQVGEERCDLKGRSGGCDLSGFVSIGRSFPRHPTQHQISHSAGSSPSPRRSVWCRTELCAPFKVATSIHQK